MDHRRLDWWPRSTNRSGSRRCFVRVVGGGLGDLLTTRVTTKVTWAQESTPCLATTTAEAEEVAEVYFAAFDSGDGKALGALLAPDYRHHGALVSE